MGISDLLPQLESITVARPLSYYRGKRAAVDILCWLHKGSIMCARDIILHNDSTKLTNYCLSRLEELVQNGIIPIVVFDGADLPIKQNTNDERRLKRQQNLEIAKQLEKEGKITEAQDYYYRAIEITPDLYVPIIRRLQLLNIDFIVAPYEADAQLGYLSRNNYVDFVITEDGDSLVYGCRCVLFKLDNGIGQEIDMNRLSQCQSLDFCGWTHDMFTYMCILSGCDYLPRLHSIGIMTAYQVVNRGRQPAAIFDQLRMKTVVDSSYEMGFLQAVFTFRHQTVFNPSSKQTAPLLPYPSSFHNQPPEYLGRLLNAEEAVGIAYGELNPITHLPYENERHEGEGMDIETNESTNSVHFSSPFISVSFKALIEKPSERGLSMCTDLSHLEWNDSSVLRKRIEKAIVVESPPRKRPSIQCVRESPISNHRVNIMFPFRMTG